MSVEDRDDEYRAAIVVLQQYYGDVPIERRLNNLLVAAVALATAGCANEEDGPLTEDDFVDMARGAYRVVRTH